GVWIPLGWLLSRSLTTEALGAEQTALARYVDGVVRPVLVRGNRVVVSARDEGRLATSVLRQRDIVSVKVWREDGVLAWTNVDPKRIGRRFSLDDELGQAISANRPIAALVGTGGAADDEDSFERNELAREQGLHHLFEVYAPIESKSGSHAIGAYEIYASPSALGRLIGSRREMLWIAVGVIFLALWGTLALLVRGASQT